MSLILSCKYQRKNCLWVGFFTVTMTIIEKCSYFQTPGSRLFGKSINLSVEEYANFRVCVYVLTLYQMMTTIVETGRKNNAFS